MILVNNTASGTRSIVTVEDVSGPAHGNDQSAVGVHAPLGGVSYAFQNLVGVGPKKFQGQTDEGDFATTGAVLATFTDNVQKHQGIGIQGRILEKRGGVPGATVFDYYRAGDRIENTIVTPGYPSGWKCIAPAVGWGLPGTRTYTTAAVVTAGDVNIQVPASVLGNVFAGLNVQLNGAGAAGANLQTRIVSITENANPADGAVLIVADVPSTAVAAATIVNLAPTWRREEPIKGVSADRGDANVTIRPDQDPRIQSFNTPLTTGRTVTLNTSAAQDGDWFIVVRTTAATAGSTLTVNGKALAAGQRVRVDYQAALGWVTTQFGSL